MCANIIKEKERGFHTLAVFLDLLKAFDTLNHSLLLTKLEKYGIRGVAIQWFKSYLEQRTLRVKCPTNDDETHTYSENYKIEFGTPQGSCLGPLLFLIYTNDIHMHLDYTKCILFADDTTIYFSHRNLNYLKFCVESDLGNIIDWFRANGLTLNLDKSECVFFNSKQIKHQIDLIIYVQGIQLPFVNTTKFLGIWVDKDLTWQKHVSVLFRKLKQKLKLLQLGKNLLDLHTKKIVYYAQFYSHLKYGLVLWGNSLTNGSKEKLQKLQNKAFATIFCKEPTVKNFHEKRILRLNDLIKLENCKLVFNCLHGNNPSKVTEAITTDINKKSLKKTHQYNTRFKQTPNHPRAQINLYNKSFLCNSIRDFDTLPAVMQQIRMLPLFVSNCKSLLYHDHH